MQVCEGVLLCSGSSACTGSPSTFGYRGAPQFAELKGKLLVVGDNFLDARLAQQGFDLADDIGVFVLGTEQRPDDAVVDGLGYRAASKPMRYSSRRLS